MPLYIKDEAVDDLAIRYQKATGAASKTAAVRNALLKGLNDLEGEPLLSERLNELHDMADKVGPVASDFSMKEFSDDLWEGR